MKKVFLLASAAFLFASVSFADNGGKKKKCAKGQSCCTKTAKAKSCCKTKTASTVKM
ncbi:MAG: hypothetical protein JWQ27_2634 [Ferruginibacter sp.]|nr:hypothetical protein [Ferruginibacter sp.]